MTDYQVFIGFEHLEKLNTASSLSFDVETLQLQPELGKLRLLQLGSTARRTIVVIDITELDEKDLAKLGRFFQNGERFWLAHNAAFDLAWLQEYGFDLRGQVMCSMLASKLLHNGMTNVKHGLKDVARRVLGVEVDKEQQSSNWGAPVLSEEQIRYAAKDVELLCELDGELRRQIVQAQLAGAYALECRALKAMAQMARTGLHWDRDKLEKVREDYQTDIRNLGREFLLQLDEGLPEEEKLPRHEDGTFNTNAKTCGSVKLGTKQYAGFNMGSSTQMLRKLTALLGEKPIDQKTGRPSASRTALREYAGDHIAIATYLAWKKAEKRRQMVESLLGKMGPDGFVRASYWQLGAETGRMTCTNPNLQQVPRDEQFRAAVVAPKGWLLVDADFSQMELRLAAVVAQDLNMMQAFIDGKDLHTATAEALGCERQIAKSANFGLLYGSGAKGLRNYAAGMGVQITLAEAHDVREKWLDTYYGIRKWHKSLNFQSDKTKDTLADIRVPVSKMRRFLPGEMNRLTIRANTPIQACGAAILKVSLGSLWKQLAMVGEDEAKLAGCVHDEILVLVREEKAEKWKAIVKRCMEDAEAKWLGDVPAIADVNVGRDWASTH
jgi:DNA polymerase I-like protein with 3'-5' exonuclease and polymerase domains